MAGDSDGDDDGDGDGVGDGVCVGDGEGELRGGDCMYPCCCVSNHFIAIKLMHRMLKLILTLSPDLWTDIVDQMQPESG